MRKKTRGGMLAWLLLFAMLCTYMPTTAYAGSAAWNGSEIDTSWYKSTAESYTISNGAELAGLAAIVNGTAGLAQDDFTGKIVTLSDDIDLGGHEWKPIGSVAVTVDETAETINANYSISGAAAFAGVFDGGSKHITNLSVTTGSGIALFGYSTGTVENVSVSGSVSGNCFVAGTAAFSSGTIKNVTNLTAINASGNCAAGILAEGLNGVKIENCYNRADVSNSSNTKSSGRVAGIVGRIDTGATGSVLKCSNTSAISGYQYVGGIIGAQFGNVTVDACYNTGSVTGISFGKVYLGGIAGKSCGGIVSNCYNTGSLHDSHWSAGHIRAVGGIVGCEEDREADTTAVTNCYNTGSISLNTSNMQYGTNWIYEVGNISGGNSSTAANTMKYENCYYLDGCIAAADKSNSSYQYWADSYKADSLIWDTSYITNCTAAELKDATVLAGLGSYFKADTTSINGGYPVLYWQLADDTPVVTYAVTSSVTGGDAAVACSNSYAAAGETVAVTVSAIQAGRQIKSVKAADAAGTALTVTKGASGSYHFTMPARKVAVSVTLENTVDEDAIAYALTLPVGLDAIWTVNADSTYLSGGAVKAGATVEITVSKESGARMTSLGGISVSDTSGNVNVTTVTYNKDTNGAGYYGVYTFTMPEEAVSVSVNMAYSNFSVYTQTGTGGTPVLKKAYTRAQMEALASTSAIYYSGYESEAAGFVGKAEKGVTLTALLKDAKVPFTSGSSLEASASDGMDMNFTYNYLYGNQRCYYPGINSGSSAGKTAVDSMLVIKGNSSTNGTIESMTCDTLNAYRFVFGQTETEFNNGVPSVAYKIVDKMPKCVDSITIILPENSSSSGKTGTGNVKAAVWDGKSIDVSWYSTTASAFYINTPAQLAGLAAIVNGIYNPDIDTIAGNESYIVDSTGTSTSGTSTSDNYHFGLDDFKGKTVYLTADLDMGGVCTAGTWSGPNYMPIGGQYLMDVTNTDTLIGSSWNGTFNGLGHTINNIFCNRYAASSYYDSQSIGLIGRMGCHDSDAVALWADQPVLRNVTINGYIYGRRSVGGIAGKMGKSNNGCLIENCANFATVRNTDSKGCGGICGASWNGGIIRNCYNAGTVISTYSGATGGIAGSNESVIANCYNIGAVSAASSGYAMAVGTNNGGGTNISNCYYLKGSAAGGGYYSSVTCSGIIAEKTSAEMRSSGFVTLLGDAFNADGSNINNGYPILDCQITAVAPTITTQPVGANYKAGNSAVALTVAAIGTDSGTLSYQWYSNTSNTKTGAAVISGATTNTYTPAASTAGTLYYFCIVTNTLTDTLKTSMATAASNIAAVTVTAASGVVSGGGGGGGGLSPTTDAVTSETTGVTYTQSGTAFTAAVTDDTIQTALHSADPVLIVDLSGAAGARSMTIAGDTLKKIIASDADASGSEEMKVILPEAEITVNAAALASISAQANGSTVTMTVNPLDARTELNTEQQSAVGGHIVYEISIKSGATAITNFNSGSLGISLPYDLKDGEAADGIVVWYINSKGEIESIPAVYDAKTGLASFKTTHLSLYAVAYDANAVAFSKMSDVTATDWYYDAADYAVINGIFSGTSAATFSPNMNMTRGMLVTVLGRMSGDTINSISAGSFSDISRDAYYAKYVAWAVEKGIVSGYANGAFGANDNVTREQMALIMFHYANYIGKETTVSTGSSAYNDAADISSWAEPGIAYCSAEGLLSGYADGRFQPKAIATRAQVATVLMNFRQ